MLVVFHGENAGSFSNGFSRLLDIEAKVVVLPDLLDRNADREAYAAADVIVGVKYGKAMPRANHLGLFHLPGAGYDAVDLAALPASAVICNCYGHEQAIAEYVMTALLSRHVPLADADRRLRKGDWRYWAGAAERTHDELAGKTIGLVGFGHIGKAIAARAKAFEMKVNVANRSPVALSPFVDHSFLLDNLEGFWGSADFIVVSVPLTPETAGIVGVDAFAAMQQSSVIFNVGRGPTIDEEALYNALKSKRIAGAVIDTWYRYPKPGEMEIWPSTLPFHELPNLVMTPHMSGWTQGTIRRRQRTIADNVARRARGEPCINVVGAGQG
jgi:phosphoglycerate dehydrogenase-like enzyme